MRARIFWATKTEDRAILDKKEADGNNNKGTLAEDNVNGQKGDVKASDTEVDANENAAVASNNSANALKTQSGAMETSAKALKIN